jgi:hypothetical protein
MFIRISHDDQPLAYFGVHATATSVNYSRPQQPGFGHGFTNPQPSWATHGSDFYYTSGDRYEVLVFNGEGTLTRIIRKEHIPVVVPRAWADSVARNRLDGVRRFIPWLAEGRGA